MSTNGGRSNPRGPLWAMLGWSFRNRLRKIAMRLREPRYLVGIVAVIVYFGWIFGMQYIGDAPGSDEASIPVERGGSLWAIGLLFLFTYLSSSGPGSAGLQITNAEAQFLLTAPIERRALIQFKLAQRVLPLLLSAAFFTLVATSRDTPSHLAVWIGFSMVAFAIQLVRTRASIYEADARRLQISLLRRAPVLPILLAGACLVLGIHLVRSVGGFGAFADPLSMIEVLPSWVNGSLPSTLLLPFSAFTGVFTAGGSAEWWQSFGIASLELVFLYQLVIRIDVPFEEASMETAVRRARILDAARRGSGIGVFRARARKGGRAPSARPTRFTIPQWGPPEVAFFWKNVVAFERHPLSRAVRYGPLAVLVVFGVLSFMLDGPRQAAATTAAILGVMGLYLLVIGPIAIRNDLRGDLSFVEMLRTLPVTGGRFVAASIGGSVATLLFVELLLLLMAAVFLGFSGYTPFPAAWLFGVLPVALLVLVPILSVSLLLHNLIALFFPAWFRPGMDRSRGIEAMGLRIVTFLSGILLLVLGIGLPGLAGAVVAGPLAFSLGPWALIPGVGAFYVVVVGEIALALEVMGRRWDRLDPGEIEQRE